MIERLELSLLDPQLRRHLGIAAAHLLDEALCVQSQKGSDDQRQFAPDLAICDGSDLLRTQQTRGRGTRGGGWHENDRFSLSAVAVVVLAIRDVVGASVVNN